jgi:hypothetical protein
VQWAEIILTTRRIGASNPATALRLEEMQGRCATLTTPRIGARK